LSRPRLIAIGPLPPPVHGVTVSTSLVLANTILHKRFCVTHVDTSDHRDGANVGTWDLTNMLVGVRNVVSLIWALRGERGTVYLPISQSTGAFLRDSLFIRGTPDNTSALRRDDSSVLFLSNLRRRKGVVEAVSAACITSKQVPDARFVFVGGWEDRQLEVELRAMARPLANRITFLTTVSGGAKDDLLARSAVLLFPPREPEGHPRVILEAMAAGLPIVATDRGAIAETIENGTSGFVLPEPEPEALADKLVQLLTDNDLRSRMSAASRDIYERRFTQEIADERLADWLTSFVREEQT
jgi:glycosyltransferase involved in cell wall biosynthesis